LPTRQVDPSSKILTSFVAPDTFHSDPPIYRVLVEETRCVICQDICAVCQIICHAAKRFQWTGSAPENGVTSFSGFAMIFIVFFAAVFYTHANICGRSAKL